MLLGSQLNKQLIMDAKVIVISELQLKTIVIDAVGAALEHFQAGRDSPHPQKSGNYVDFVGLLKEYYPGIPASTVRQDTAHLSKAKVGKRVLFNRDEVEDHLNRKRLPTHRETKNIVEQQFVASQQRRGGRTTK